MKRLILILALLVVVPTLVLAQQINLVLTAPSGVFMAMTYTLRWTAPGDDGNIGTCDHYELRSFPDTTTAKNNWSSGTLVTTPTPQIAGTPQSATVILPDNSIFVFAIKAYDESGNVGPISNFVTIRTADTVSPGPITDLRTP